VGVVTDGVNSHGAKTLTSSHAPTWCVIDCGTVAVEEGDNGTRLGVTAAGNSPFKQ
jgi:hypothetical protein